jgi:tRNA/tmRNA/rRNA uracil-C5-methylase (TrmA/RlmC/RlmD family)
MLRPGDVVELTIEKPAAGGRMVARHEGLVTLVQAAIPGERVRAVVERTGQGVAYATVMDVIEASPDRRAGVRDWACGGNVYAHIAYERQRTIKGEVIADALARIGKVVRDQPIPVSGGAERGYRMRARFHVRGQTIGFFREGTHGLCDPKGTGQLLPETDRLIDALASSLADRQLVGVTEIELAENVPANERALHLELDRPAAPIGLEALARLDTVVGVSASFLGRGDAVRPGGRRTITAGGVPSVHDTIVVGASPSADGEGTGGGVAVNLTHHVQAFFQGNRYLLADLASRVLSLVPETPVVDLYAGVGLFTVSLAARGARPVVAVEGDRSAAIDLRTNVKPYGDAITAVETSVEAYLAEHPVPRGTTIVIDPPRTGMSKAASAAVAAQDVERLVYVSCDVATFARDCRKLIDAGFALDHLEAFDLFPNTAHVEVVAAFSRT